MMLFSFAAIESKVFSASYRRRVARKYDAVSAVLNGVEQPALTKEVFAEFGIRSLAELNRHLRKNTEYGGCVRVTFRSDRVLIPFHNDFMNNWLRFDNPRVEQFYHELYLSKKDDYFDEWHFRCKRFDIEEELQANNWIMPAMDRRMLAAPINGCWDKPELLARFLELQGFRTKRLCCHDGHEMRGHCFTVYTDGKFWMTTNSFPLRIKHRSYEALCRKLLRLLRFLPIFSDRSKCVLVEYAPAQEGMTGRDYVEQIINGTVVAGKIK